MNILYIHSHDTGRYVQPYGHAIPTANIQRLAEQGILFRQAFCAGPTCSPSRAALLTGVSPHSAACLGLAHRGFHIRDVRQHLPHLLRKQGYVTAMSGMQHTAKDQDLARDCYDHMLPKAPGDAGPSDPAVRWLRDYAKSPSRPFFLSVGFFETHRFGTSGGYFQNGAKPLGDPRYVRPPAPIPDTPQTRQDMADFILAAGRLDAQMGQVFLAIDELGLSSDTLVICTTDHGIAFPGMKCDLSDHGMGVMLIMRGPGGFEGGKVIDAMVSQIDIVPTIFELIGHQAPASVEGRSIMPLIRGEATEINEEVYGEVTFHAAYEPKRAVRTKRWKYIRRFDGRGRRVLPNTDDGLSRQEMERSGWRDEPVPGESLFDLALDPNEMNNLAGSALHAHVLLEMRSRLQRWMKRTNDPLLAGEVKALSGCKVNPVDGIYPYEPCETIPWPGPRQPTGRKEEGAA